MVLHSVKREQFEKEYGDVFGGDAEWKAIAAPTGSRYVWDDKSTYVKHPPYFEGMSKTAPGVKPIAKARVLGMFGDSITTDHISPAARSPRSRRPACGSSRWAWRRRTSTPTAPAVATTR